MLFNFISYSAWEELLPNQPYSQNVSLSPNGGDSFWALAWVGDANRQYDPNGGYAWFNMWDLTQKQGVLLGMPLSGTRFYGYTGEWIMERPYLSNGQYAQLSDYGIALMSNPEVLTSSFNWTYFSNVSNTQLWMYNGYLSGNDNNLLSIAQASGPTSIYYYWTNYH